MDDLLRGQEGTVSRRQLLAAGWTSVQVDRAVRRRELVVIHPGVYVEHNGPLTAAQRRWAAVLYAAPAALHLEHALPDPPGNGPVDVAIDWTRRVATRPGIRVHRVRGLDVKTRWNQSPPRVRLEVATLALAARAVTDLDAIARLTDAVGGRRTTADRLADALAAQPRLPRHRLLTGLVADLRAGTHSVLEHGYLDRVVRPHGLPEPSSRQHARLTGGRAGYRDIGHLEVDAHVELDGGTHDDRAQRDVDADHDLDDLADGLVTPRLRYHQVFGTPCRTADRLARFFAGRGWQGTPRPCSTTCQVDAGSSD